MSAISNYYNAYYSSSVSGYSWLFGSSSSSNNNSSFDLINSLGNASLYNSSGYRTYLQEVYKSDSVKENNTAATAYNNLASATADLASSAIKVSSSDAFKLKDGETEYDTEKITGLVQDFVNNYNEVIKNATSVKNINSLQRTKFLINDTNSNKNLLSKVGISINENNTLTLNTETLKNADMSNVKTLFSGYNSYASKVSTEASSINRIVNNEISANNKSYAYQYTSGTMLDSYI